MIFAAKTTASGLIALLIALTFNLDQPQWALLTVFVVSQPQSGLVLAKSFYRIIGTVIAAVFAAGVTLVLWAVIAPETAEAARSRFLRVARQAASRLIAPHRPIGVAEFETRIADGLDQLHGHLRADRPADIAALQAGMRLLGAGRALRRQEPGQGAPIGAFGQSGISDPYVADLLKRGRAEPDVKVHRDAA